MVVLCKNGPKATKGSGRLTFPVTSASQRWGAPFFFFFFFKLTAMVPISGVHPVPSISSLYSFLTVDTSRATAHKTQGTTKMRFKQAKGNSQNICSTKLTSFGVGMRNYKFKTSIANVCPAILLALASYMTINSVCFCRHVGGYGSPSSTRIHIYGIT